MGPDQGRPGGYRGQAGVGGGDGALHLHRQRHGAKHWRLRGGGGGGGARPRSPRATDGLPLPLWATTPFFGALFVVATWFLLRRWQAKSAETADKFSHLSAGEVVAIIAEFSSFVYLIGFCGIGYVQAGLGKGADGEDESDDASDGSGGGCDDGDEAQRQAVGGSPTSSAAAASAAGPEKQGERPPPVGAAGADVRRPPITRVASTVGHADAFTAAMSDDTLANAVVSGQLPSHLLEDRLGDPARAVAVRRRAVELRTGRSLDGLPHDAYDYASVVGACCEMVIGHVPIPVGVAGPLLLDGVEYSLPMATTEGCLVASTNRGCKAIALSHGATSVLLRDSMTRAPVVRFASIVRTVELKRFLDDPANFEAIAEDFNSSSRYGSTSQPAGLSRFARLQSVSVALAGRNAYLRFGCFTGDAMGMNMASKGTQQLLESLRNRHGFLDMEVISISGNFCADKKSTAVNWIEGRGKSVVCEAVIPGAVVNKVLKTTVAALVELNMVKNLAGSAIAGAMGGFNAHASNIVTAVFIATGQDPAQNVESSNCITMMEAVNGGADLHASVTMPSIEVGTVGGGTFLAPQAASLNMLGVRGPHPDTPGTNAQRLARIVAGAVLAGELSLMAALAAGQLVAVAFTVGPGCDVAHLVVDLVARLGGATPVGGAEMSITAWDSPIARQVIISALPPAEQASPPAPTELAAAAGSGKPGKGWTAAASREGALSVLVFVPLLGEAMPTVEYVKDGQLSERELDAIVSSVAIAAGGSTARQWQANERELRKGLEGEGSTAAPLPPVPGRSEWRERERAWAERRDRERETERQAAQRRLGNEHRDSSAALEKLEALGVKVYRPAATADERDGGDDSALPGADAWGTLAGYEEQKREIEDTILLALRRPEVYDSVARGTRRRFESNRPRAVLFEGPPGTGKTSSARVIAAQEGVSLLYVPLEAIASKYYGESERLLASVFAASKTLQGGAIVFLDEIDALATARSGEMHEATRRILSVLLRQMDGFERDSGVVVIAATNRMQDLDPALISCDVLASANPRRFCSRFDASIHFDLPDERTRAEITAQYAKQLSREELGEVAAACAGMSGRDIRDVCEQAERHWASKLIRKGVSAQGGPLDLPPLAEYLTCAQQRQHNLPQTEKQLDVGSSGLAWQQGTAAHDSDKGSRSWHPLRPTAQDAQCTARVAKLMSH
eukprot:SM000131S26764  [mRNA]  locus=s131:394868:403223:- [translate_table: standard]